jgi:stage V sporulation protein SpoVS
MIKRPTPEHHCLAPSAWAQISSKEEPRHYSAKIAWNARNNSHMPLLATGAPAINCAVKVCAPPARGQHACPGPEAVDAGMQRCETSR